MSSLSINMASFPPKNNNKRLIIQQKLFQSENFSNPMPFRETVRLFIDEFGEKQNITVNGTNVWCSSILTKNDGVLKLYIVEETAGNSSVDDSFCQLCKISGWGHHYVCKRKYHFVIPEIESWNEPLEQDFTRFRSHYLYGLIHCNGFGHLICVNESSDDSILFAVSEAMALWNDICTLLKARKVSVVDDFVKGSVELRLMYGLACGESLFGRWGYKYSGESEQKYASAIRFLSSLGLDRVVGDKLKRNGGKRIKDMVNKYRRLSEKPLVTIRDLLQFMLGYESRNGVYDTGEYRVVSKEKETPVGIRKFVDSMARSDSRWPARRLQNVVIAIVNVLKGYKAFNLDSSVSRNELREETRKSIGDTGLIDFVLKCIKCFQVDNLIIRRVINPSANRAGFTIHEVGNKAELMDWPVLSNDGRWSQDKLENAVEVVMSILAENRGKDSVALPELRDKARECINDMDLIEFVLKSLDKSQIGNKIVYRTKNPITKRVEFALAENELFQGMDNLFTNKFSQDMLFIYEKVLLSYPRSSAVSLATRVILESKQFVKEWPSGREVVNNLMTVTCKVLPSFEELETELTRRLSPGEIVVVPPWITIGDLMLVVQSALRDTYCVMDEFVVRQIGGLRPVKDEVVLSSTVEPGGLVWVRGTGMDLVTKLRYEDGAQRPGALGSCSDRFDLLHMK